MKVWLKPDVPDEVRVAAGGYSRVFTRDESDSGGFEVDEVDWDRVLKLTGYFVASPPKADSAKKKTGPSPRRAESGPQAPSGGPSKAKEG